MVCAHLDSIREITPSANGWEDCLKTGDSWALLRACRQCGHIGCCDPREPWGWRSIDQEMLDFSGRQTIHRHASSVAFEDRKR